MRSLEDIVGRLNVAGVRGEIWLDGSFVTNKDNPLDIDLILIADSDQYDNDPHIRPIVDLLVEPAEWPPPVADTNVVFRDPPDVDSNFEDVLPWWERRFGTHPTKGLPREHGPDAIYSVHKWAAVHARNRYGVKIEWQRFSGESYSVNLPSDEVSSLRDRLAILKIDTRLELDGSLVAVDLDASTCRIVHPIPSVFNERISIREN